VFHEPCLQGKRSRNQVPAVDYFYSAAKRRSRGALWSIFAPALIDNHLMALRNAVPIEEYLAKIALNFA
jgi:hypothetical protein